MGESSKTYDEYGNEKITYEKACKLLKKGKQVKCRISSKEMVNIKDQSDLDIKKRLGSQGVQLFELYYEKPIKEVPDNAAELTVDDAFELINNGQTICFDVEGKEEGINNEVQLTTLIRSALVRGERPLMYWYV